MDKILSNSQDWWAIAVRFYKYNILPEDIVIWSKSDTIEQLKLRLKEILTAKGSSYKKKYDTQLLKAMR